MGQAPRTAAGEKGSQAELRDKLYVVVAEEAELPNRLEPRRSSLSPRHQTLSFSHGSVSL